MELTFHSAPPFPSSSYYTTRLSKLKDCNALQRNSFFPFSLKSKELGVKVSIISAGLPESAASIAVAATVVGAAATLLVRRTKASEATEAPQKFVTTVGDRVSVLNVEVKDLCPRYYQMAALRRQD